MANRGRPAGRMTPLRKKALAILTEEALAGKHLTYSKVARHLGLKDYRSARRIVRDLRALGHDVSCQYTGTDVRCAPSTEVTLNRVSCANHRARRAGAEGCFSVADIERMMREQNEQCAICDVHLSVGYHIDHRIPLSAGGDNHLDNIQLLCAPCNRRKSSKPN